jgi:hypothetical protein
VKQKWLGKKCKGGGGGTINSFQFLWLFGLLAKKVMNG